MPLLDHRLERFSSLDTNEILPQLTLCYGRLILQIDYNVPLDGQIIINVDRTQNTYSSTNLVVYLYTQCVFDVYLARPMI